MMGIFSYEKNDYQIFPFITGANPGVIIISNSPDSYINESRSAMKLKNIFMYTWRLKITKCCTICIFWKVVIILM
jgi:hypothetical protein